jgi:hypothetical protein
MANVNLNLPSHLDLPEYKTSSTTVRPDWSNYTWTIVAEFFDPSHAYSFEQQLIYDNWDNPLLLNGHYNLGESQFRNIGPKSAETRQKISDAKKGIPRSAETRQKMSDAKKGKPAWNKGKPGKPNQKKGILTGPRGKQQNPAPEIKCPHCGLVGGASGMIRWHFDNCKKNPIINTIIDHYQREEI